MILLRIEKRIGRWLILLGESIKLVGSRLRAHAFRSEIRLVSSKSKRGNAA